MQNTTPNDNSPTCFADAPEWVRLKVAARIAGGVSTRTIQRWISMAYVSGVKPAGGLVLVNRDSLRVFIEGSERASGIKRTPARR